MSTTWPPTMPNTPDAVAISLMMASSRFAGTAFSRRGIGQHLEGHVQKPVAGKDRDGLSVHLVAGGPAPAKIVVVHGRQIVMDERVGMDQLERSRDRQEIGCLRAQRLGRRDRQDRPHPFASREQAVPHGLMHDGRKGFLPGTSFSSVLSTSFSL